MLGLRKRFDAKKASELLLAVLHSMPPEHAELSDRLGDLVRADKITKVAPSPTDIPHYLSISYKRGFLDEYGDVKAQYVTIGGVKAFHKGLDAWVELVLYVDLGIVIGLSTNCAINNLDFDTSKLDLSQLTVTQPKAFDLVQKQLEVSGIDSSSVNVSDVYEVKVNGRSMLHLKELSDGDFLASCGQEFYIVSIEDREAIKLPERYQEQIRTSLNDLSTDELYSFVQD